MVANVKRDKLRFTDGLMDYLQLVDYRLAESAAEKDKIYQFRYQSYLRENTIDENPSERFSDDYDQLDNCWIFGIDYQDQLASSIRIHVATSEHPKSPSLDVFPDIVVPLLESGHKIIDPTRFVADSSTTNFFPVLPFLTFRLACMASDYFDADYCLIPVN
jgi:N-acyl-L-homoserine lactone synthetase